MNLEDCLKAPGVYRSTQYGNEGIVVTARRTHYRITGFDYDRWYVSASNGVLDSSPFRRVGKPTAAEVARFPVQQGYTDPRVAVASRDRRLLLEARA